jgi:NAD(P)-dependent dehydrogenase (short-subunit alcohol dehydrogenase family)
MKSTLFDLSGRTAAVTGAARGLGRVLARGLAAHGARVVVGDLNEEGARQTADHIKTDGGEASAVGLDVCDRRSCETFVQHSVRQFGQLDVLVNNAAIDVLEPVRPAFA